jgi:hypothetical protein
MAATYKISGTIVDDKALPVASTVELWVSAGASDFLATTAASDSDGAFVFVFTDENIANGTLSSEGSFPLLYVRANIGIQKQAVEITSVFSGGHSVVGNINLFTLESSEAEIQTKLTSNNESREQLTFIFKAIDGNEDALVGARVSAIAIRSGMDDLSLGESNCDSNGYFKLFMSFTPDEWTATAAATKIEFTVDHLDSEGAVIESASTELDFEDRTEIAEVRKLTYKVLELSFSGVIDHQVPSQSIAALFTALSITPSSEVSDHLTENELTSLRNVRMSGFVDPERFEAEGDKVVVGKLNAHAQLELATSNVELREHYLTIGYNSLRSIASVARHDFIKAGEDLESISILEKGKLHEVALAQFNVVKNITMGVRANQKRVSHPVDIEIEEKHGAACGCEDCMSAVSPLAYLADLIIYATGHLQITNGSGGYNNISVSQLQDLFHQPFGDLPVACDEMTKNICQYRIGVEILRAYQEELATDGDAAHPSDCQNTNITRAEKDYLWKAYETLLQLFGTSFDEVRRARNLVPGVDDDQILSIGRRLGLFVAPIWAPITSISSGVITINGNFAEQIFGDEGEGKITIYSEYSNEGIYSVSSATFGSGVTNISVTPSPTNSTGTPPFGFIECGNAKRIHSMLVGLYLSPEDNQITEEELESIFGLRDSNRAPLDDQPVPLVLNWRLRTLRENWRLEDSLNDEFSTRKRPIIDPDTISLDDLRYPEEGAVLGIWNARRVLLDGRHGIMRSKVTPKGVLAGLDRFILPTSALLNSDAFPTEGSKLVVTDSNGCDGIYTVVNATSGYVEVKEVIPFNATTGNLRFQFSVPVGDYSYSTGSLVLLNMAGLADEIIPGMFFVWGDYAFEVLTAVVSDVDCEVTFSEIVGVTFPLIKPLFFVGERVLDSVTLGTETSLRGFRVKGDFEGDLPTDSLFEIINSSQNNGSYTVVTSDYADGHTTIDIGISGANGYLRNRIEDGFIQYTKQLGSCTVNLGNNSFQVSGRDLTALIDLVGNAMKVVLSSSNSDDYVATVAPGTYYDFVKKTTYVQVTTAIQGTTADGFIKLEVPFSIETGTTPDQVVIAGADVSGAIKVGDSLVFSNAVPNTVILEVATINYTSPDTVITFVGTNLFPSGYTTLTVEYPITGVILTGKHISGVGDLRNLLFPGMTLRMFPGLDVEGPFYEVIVESVTSDKVFISTPFEPGTLNGDDIVATFQPKLPIVRSRFKIQGADSAFEYMEHSDLENEGDESTWTISIPLIELATNLRTGVGIQESTDSVETGLNLSVDAFLTLMDLAEKDQRYEEGDEASWLTDKEWESFFNILLSAYKKNLSSDWIIEEAQASITLNPEHFWISQREPQMGNWPNEIDNGLPIIDPEYLGLSAMPDANTLNSTGDPIGECRVLLSDRKERLSALLARLNNGQFGNYSTDIIRFFFGGVNPMDDPRISLHAIRADLNNVDPEISTSATRVIEDELKISVKDFSALMGYFDRLDTQGYVISASDRSVFHPMLISVYRQRFLLSEWKLEENAVEYYQVRRPQLPQWRSSGRIRNNWIEALTQRSSLPVIDPDVVKYSDFVSFTSPAFDLWLTRRDALTAIEVDFTPPTPPVADIDWIKEVIYQGLKFKVSEDPDDFVHFSNLILDEEAGINITPRLAQLGLTASSYRRLRKLYEVAEAGSELLESEWKEVIGILSGVKKKRLFAQWRDEEAALKITNGPDTFKLDPMAFHDHAFDPDPVRKWRTTARERRDWLRILQTRIEDEAATKEAISHMVAETEDLTLRILRDALVQLCGNPEKFLYENAEELTTRFMFDFKTTCCQRTTRISQAIDTLQMLNWSEWRGLLEEGPLDLRLNAPQFEQEWKWIGSYATWRSAMFVFIFPENLLYPTLKRAQSQGFKDFAETLRSNPRITPETVCKTAKEYSSYLEDISSHLRCEVSCTAKTLVFSGNCDNRYQRDYEDLFYVFAKSTKTKKVYYSVGSGGNYNIDGQGFWILLDGLGENVLKVFAAVPYQPIGSANRRLIVIASVKEKGKTELVTIRMDLDTQHWDSEYQILTLPDTVGTIEDWDVAVQQRHNIAMPIQVLVNRTFVTEVEKDLDIVTAGLNVLNDNGDDWTSDWYSNIHPNLSWQSYHYPYPQLSEFKILAFHLVRGGWWQRIVLIQYMGHFYLNVQGQHEWHGGIRILTTINEPLEFVGSSTFPYEGGGGGLNDYLIILFRKAGSSQIFQISIELPNQEVAPSSHLSFLDCIYSYVAANLTDVQLHEHINDLTESGSTYNAWLSTNILWLGEHTTEPINVESSFNNVHRLVPNWCCTSLNPSEQFLHAVQVTGVSQIARFNMIQRINGNLDMAPFVDSSGTSLSMPVIITPVMTAPNAHHLSSKLLREELILRRDHIQSMFVANYSPAELRIKYIEESYYFIPMLAGLTLQQRGHFDEALSWFSTVYDFRQDQLPKRKIWYGLRLEESITESFGQSAQWLLDPLNPHQLAATRPNSYTRYTVLAIARCLLEYADAEFTIDTVESVSRARELYRQALELLEVPELAIKSEDCHCDDHTDEVIRRVSCELEPEQLANWMWAITATMQNLESYDLCPHGDALFDAIADLIIADPGSPSIISIEDIEAEMEADLELSVNEPDRYEDMIGAFGSTTDETTAPVFGFESVDMALFVVGNNAGNGFEQRVEYITGKSKDVATDSDHSWLETGIDTGELPINYHPGKLLNPDMRFNDPMAPSKTGLVYEDAARFPNWTQEHIDKFPGWYVPTVNTYFCVPDNPIISALRMRAELNLFKLRNCMNIAGMKRELDPYTAPTDTVSGLPSIGAGGQLVLPGSVRIRPTQYRYEVIIERAKQLVALSQQMEANFLAALEKRDAEYYNRLKAKQDLNLSKAQVKLQDLRVKVAEGEVRLAELQRDRAELQVEELQGMIQEGLLGIEKTLEGLYIAQAALESISRLFSATTSASAANAMLVISAQAAAAVAGATGAAASLVGGAINVTQLYASQARREQEWGYQINMATQDIAIGNQGIAVAQSRVRVAGQEKRISELQVDHAEATVEFLNTKFTNVDLYDWMSGVLEGVYAYFLQQATATAKIAQGQLAFERQELPPGFIVDDYWEFPTDSMAVSTVGSGSSDRRGMTGSARLLQDITKLDQYAFDTDKRKLQITRTFSLARLSPIEFQRFRETGVLTFSTSMEHFDRDFAGHYLRLIREVRVSVIALTPSTEGIRATLTSSGVSRVVIGGDVFQTVAIRRDPEVIAFSGTRDANGLFQMQANDRFMKPFEGSGVEMLWELRMPRESNLFDFGSIADVLFTIDYTAFNDFNYRQQVLRNLPPFHSAEMPFSFRGQFPDQFYQLANPEQNEEGIELPVTVEFVLRRSDFPPGISVILIKEIKLYLATDSGEILDDLDDEPFTFGFNETPNAIGSSGASIQGVEAMVIDNLITPRNNQSMMIFRNKSPFGAFSMTVPNQLSPLLREGKVLDLMFVVTYTAEFPLNVG